MSCVTSLHLSHSFLLLRVKKLFAIIDSMTCVYCIPAATINIESAGSPPGEGDSTGTAAVLRLTTNPAAATLAENVAVSIAVMTGGSETATGKIC